MKRSMMKLFILALIVPFLFLGCAGDDGSSGAEGLPGKDAPSPAASAQPESCSVCHNGAAEANGTSHQASYDELYQDDVIKVTNLAYTNNGTSDIVTFDMNQDCTKVTNLNIYFVEYDGANFQFTPAQERLSIKGGVNGVGTLSYAAGVCTSTKPQSTLGDLNARNGLVIVYGYDGLVKYKISLGKADRVRQVKFPYAALIETGTAGVDYVSAANNAGCVKCHTDPYLKHGNIYAQVGKDPATDFYTCKACHLDDGEGGHFIWQVLVDDPQLSGDLFAAWVANGRPASGDESELEWYMTPEQQAKYAYRTTLMNDVHMSHAMEFPYPQSMSNCVTCHDKKLDLIFAAGLTADTNTFTVETCKSCHPVTGGKDDPKTDKDGNPVLDDGDPIYTVDTTDLALANLVPQTFAAHDPVNWDTIGCYGCHYEGNVIGAPLFSAFHSGYDKRIYTAGGVKYADAFTVTIDTASFADNKLTFEFQATESPDIPGLAVTDIVPTVMVGLYGWNTKDYIFGPHERSFDDNGDGKVDSSDQRNLEYVVGRTNHPRFTTVSAAGGKWKVTADLSAWADNVADGTVRRVEIAVMPNLKADVLKYLEGKETLALNAPSRTFDLASKTFVDFYSPIVKVSDGCNNCHEALATTFHSGDRGGSIVVCRLCHITKSGGSHLEMQSRSIDSYVHAIHTFQYFDTADVDFKDPVERLHYEDHTEKFPYPTHGITNCKSCHTAGTFDVPDQSKSMPGLLSASETYNGPLNGWDRNIGAVPAYVTGPASRACGGCHRAEFINEDDPGELAAFNSHTRTFGYLVEQKDTELDIVIATIMQYFL